MKKLLSFALVFISYNFTTAQTLVNKTMEVATGHPDTFYEYHALSKDASDNYYLTGNTVEPIGGREVFFIAKFNYDGLQWMNIYDTTITGWRVFATDLTSHGTNLGTAVDTNRIHSVYITAKIDSAGNQQWVRYWENSSYYGLNGATSVRMVQDPTNGNYHLMVTGSTQTDTADAGIATIGYEDSIQTDYVLYDSAGLYDIPALVTIDSTKVYITGASGSTFGNWDFLTLAYTIHGGGAFTAARSPNGNGSYAQVTGITKDIEKNIYITGYYTDSTGHTNIKTIKYDSLLNELWVHIYDGAAHLSDQATSMYMSWDNGHTFYVSGYTMRSNGAKDLLLLKYDADTGLVWQRTITAEDNTKDAVANKVVTDGDDNSYVTGKAWHNGMYCYATAAYDPYGNVRWLKYNQADGSTYNEAKEMLFIDPNKIVVSGIVYKPSDTTYVTVEYEQLSISTTTVTDTSNHPLYKQNQIIVRFNPDAVNNEFASNRDKVYATLSDAISDSALLSRIDSALNGNGKSGNWIVKKIFREITPSDSLSITRLGDTILLPKLWSSFLLVLKPNQGLSGGVEEMRDSLNTMFPGIFYAHLNYVGTEHNTANDTYYTSTTPNENQTSLVYNPTLNPDGDPSINIEEAWNYESGKSHVRVGVFENGDVDWQHEDFEYNTSNHRVAGAYYVFTGVNRIDVPPAVFDDHLTSCAGIIGASTNNSIGIAGIAGGGFYSDGITLDEGVRLYSLCVGDDDYIDLESFVSGLFQSTTGVIHTLPYQYELDLISCSFGINTDDIATLPYPAATPQILKEVLFQVYRHQTTVVCSRGNTVCPSIPIPPQYPVTYPACIREDDWIIVTGGTGTDGQKINCGSPGNTTDHTTSYADILVSPGVYYAPIDIAAPFDVSNICSLLYGNAYGNFSRTSAACPHVAGTAALLLSAGPSLLNGDNFSPEDVQNILELSATDINGGTYDTYTGWGRLNAGNALETVFSKRLAHFGTGNSSFPGILKSGYPVVTNDVAIVLEENVTDGYQGNVLLQGVPAESYIADRYEYKYIFDTDLVPGTDIVDEYWVRNSSSDLFHDAENETLDPYPHMFISNIDETNPNITKVEVTGYVYYVHSYYDNTPLSSAQWIPYSNTVASDLAQVNVNFSLLVTTTPTVVNDKIDPIEISAKCLPNVGANCSTLQIISAKKTNVEIDLYNMFGQHLGKVFSGQINEGTNTINPVLDKYSSGCYYYVIGENSNTQVIKFIKL